MGESGGQQPRCCLGWSAKSWPSTRPALLSPGVEGVTELKELLGRSDVVSLHLPLTPDSAGMVDADFLAAMAPGSLLVNVSRGGLVDEAALVDALESGHLAGAALDVFPTEPLPLTSPILKAKNTFSRLMSRRTPTGLMAAPELDDGGHNPGCVRTASSTVTS